MVEQQFNLIAKTFFGLEDVLAAEIEKIGGENIEKGRRMVKYTGDLGILYKSNIYLRTALRVLKNVTSFKIGNQEDYYRFLLDFEWEKYLGLHHSFAIDAIVNSTIFNNSLFAAQRAKDALVDRFRKKYHKRPLVNTNTPDVLINLHISENTVNIAMDSSGVSLHRRGYREAEGPAPLNQVLAAAMIYLSDWKPETPFVDPMTGSGTLAIEAAMIARNIPPGMVRKDFCFQNWPDYDKKLYHQLMDEIELNDIKPKIFANDISEQSIEIARYNAQKANISSFIRFSNKSFKVFEPKTDYGTVIINPPYGERMKQDKIYSLYQEIGDVLKLVYTDYQAWIISSNKEAVKKIGLRPKTKINLYNGSLECLYSGFDLFQGTMKKFKTDGKTSSK
jgi:putative N6-adenine-specific DNA methylase